MCSSREDKFIHNNHLFSSQSKCPALVPKQVAVSYEALPISVRIFVIKFF